MNCSLDRLGCQHSVAVVDGPHTDHASGCDALAEHTHRLEPPITAIYVLDTFMRKTVLEDTRIH